MGRKVVGFWLSIIIVFGFVIIVDVTVDFTLHVGGTTLYVNETGSGGAYTSIQDAINAAIDGDTVFVYNGTYYENVVVNKTINLTGEGIEKSIIDGGGSGKVVNIIANWVNMTGLKVTGGNSTFWDGGIYLDYVENCSIENVECVDNYYGIYLFQSSSNIIINNNASSNNEAGIYVYYSNENTIANNTISSNIWEGIYLFDSSNNILFNNNLTDDGILILGDVLDHWNTHSIDTTNTVNGKPVQYWKNQTGGIIPSGSGQIILANSTNVVVDNQNVCNGSVGIQLGFSWNNTITNNTVSLISFAGIKLSKSSNNIITYNNASITKGYGIYLGLSSGNNTVTNNNVNSNNLFGIGLSSSNNNTIVNNNASNNHDGISIKYSNDNIISNNNVSSNSNDGIYFFDSADNIITNNNASLNIDNGVNLENSINNTIYINNISSNNLYGIRLHSSDSNTIAHNNAHSNERHGIYISVSDNNTIKNNNANLNKWYGIYLGISSNNRIFHNNIINNIDQAFDDTNNGNQWDNGYPSGGNYWSDYVGNDSYKGPNQDISGSDGIGDTPYIIDSNSRDNYPLMQPYKPLENYLILKQGWNLISIPLIQEEQNLTRVLGSIDSWYNAVQWYDAIDSNDYWKHNKVNKPYGNDLSQLNETMSLWIHITQHGDTIFLYNGTQPTQNQTIPLHPGWNMVGYPSMTSYNRTEGLNNLTFNDQVDAIWSYDAATQKWEEMRESDYFEIGKGYYIHAKSKCEWEVPL